MILVWLIFSDVNFDYFIKVIFARLFCCEVNIFPFVNSKLFVGGALRSYMYILFLTKLSPNTLAFIDDF